MSDGQGSGLSRLFHLVQDRTQTPASAGPEEERARLDGIIARLEKSPTGRDLLTRARKLGYTIGFSQQVSRIRAYGLCDWENRKVLLNRHAEDDLLVATLAHELRHAQQADRGLRYTNYDSPRSALLRQRVMEADAQAVSARAAAEQRDVGDEAPWRAFARTYPDLAAARIGAARPGADPGEPLRATFDAWFRSAPSRVYYEDRLLSWYEAFSDEMLKDKRLFAREDKLGAVLGELPVGGKTYMRDIDLSAPLYCGVTRETRERLADVLADRQQLSGVPASSGLAGIPIHDEGGEPGTAMYRIADAVPGPSDAPVRARLADSFNGLLGETGPERSETVDADTSFVSLSPARRRTTR